MFTHVLQHCFMLGRMDLYDACRPIIKNGLLDWDTGTFVTSINNVEPFRQLDWSKHTDELDFLVANNLVRAVATYRDDQVIFLKDYLRDRIKIINITYDSSDYNFMLDSFVRIHLYRQDLGLTPITEHDQQIRGQGLNLVDYFTQAFSQANLIPKFITNTGDYNIPVSQLLNEETFIQQVLLIGGNDTPAVRDFYRQWQQISQRFTNLV